MNIDDAVAEYVSKGVTRQRQGEISKLLEAWTEPVTPEQALRAMREIVAADDEGERRYLSPDEEHATADDVLCALLRSLGCGQVVDEYLKLSRYFA
jgi:hypothetical protein